MCHLLALTFLCEKLIGPTGGQKYPTPIRYRGRKLQPLQERVYALEGENESIDRCGYDLSLLQYPKLSKYE